MHPQLGTLSDLDELIRQAGELGLELALDLAFQAADGGEHVDHGPARALGVAHHVLLQAQGLLRAAGLGFQEAEVVDAFQNAGRV